MNKFFSLNAAPIIVAGILVAATTGVASANHPVLVEDNGDFGFGSESDRGVVRSLEDGGMEVSPPDDSGPQSDIPENTRRKPENSRTNFAPSGLTVTPGEQCDDPDIGALVPVCR